MVCTYVRMCAVQYMYIQYSTYVRICKKNPSHLDVHMYARHVYSMYTILVYVHTCTHCSHTQPDACTYIMYIQGVHPTVHSMHTVNILPTAELTVHKQAQKYVRMYNMYICFKMYKFKLVHVVT